MPTTGYFHFTAQYFPVSSPVTPPSKQLCFIFADVHTHSRLFPLMSAAWQAKPSVYSPGAESKTVWEGRGLSRRYRRRCWDWHWCKQFIKVFSSDRDEHCNFVPPAYTAVIIFRTWFRKEKKTKIRFHFQRVFLTPLTKEAFSVRSSYWETRSGEQLVEGVIQNASLCSRKLNVLTKMNI